MPDKNGKRTIGDHVLSPESLMMSYGYRPEWSEGAVKPPIFQTSTFAFRTADEGKAFFDTGVALITDAPVEGLESYDSAWGLENCWG